MNIQDIILRGTGADRAVEGETIQNLWSGYGSIIRYHLKGAPMKSLIVKHVRFAGQGRYHRSRNRDLSHERKLHSYKVETAWYRDWQGRCDSLCRIPRCFALESSREEVVMVLEDLDAAGFPERRRSVSDDDISACLSWLAHFHACFMGESPRELWETGTYWHLETRPEELAVLDDRRLKKAAAGIDRRLSATPWKTLVHGDAKLANFCFPRGPVRRAAAVDFQYVGGGCGMKDLVYFIGSCLYEEECEAREEELLDRYFLYLREALVHYSKDVDAPALEEDWRELFPWAWTDFHRFLKGWSPGHWDFNSYSEKTARKVLEVL